MTKKKMGRPKGSGYKPSDKERRMVEAMVGHGGSTHEQIAIILGIDPKTLRKHFRKELDLGTAKAHAKMASHMYNRAFESDPMAIWYSKAQMGWRETSVTELTGKDGGAIKVESPRDKIAARLERMAASLNSDE